MKNNILSAIICTMLATSLMACNVNDEDESGTLSLNITDGPIDAATEVVVVFSAIEIKPQQGPSFTITFDPAKTIDLLALQNGESSSILQNEDFEAGNYNWLRLLVDADENEIDSYITLEDGSQFSLYVPSGSETGLKINRNFTIAVGESVNFMIDFDLRKSVLEPNNQSVDYKLKPVLRITDLTQVGTISGFIDASIVSDDSCESGLAIYAYSGSDVLPNDEGSDTPPLTTAIPTYDNNTDRYNYSLSFLSVGDYTIAVTCDADNDDSETDESNDLWNIISSANATVVIDVITELNFE